MAQNAELEALIAATGKTKGEFAKAAQISRDGLNKYLSGKRKRPQVREVGSMAAAAGVNYETMRAAILGRRAEGTSARVSSEDDVDRREFLITGSAAIATANLLLHGFNDALRDEPRGRDAWEARLDAHGRAYMTHGADEMRSRLSDDLIKIKGEPRDVWRWGIAARLMALYAKTFPGTDGARALAWYRMASEAADRSGDVETRIWVRGRAAIALGYEGAAAPTAYQFAKEALALAECEGINTVGLLNAQMGGAHAATLLGNLEDAGRLLTAGRKTFDVVGASETVSDFNVPWWRQGVYSSLLLARMGKVSEALLAQSEARRVLPANLPRFATHLDLHTALLIGKAGDKASATSFAEKTMSLLPSEKHSLTLRLLTEEIQKL